MVVDEAHEIRNERSRQSLALNRVVTKRRIALTGYPLQNNIKEYYTMIHFVSPGMLGDKKGFMKRFGNVIAAGFEMDATGAQKSAMRKKLSALKAGAYTRPLFSST